MWAMMCSSEPALQCHCEGKCTARGLKLRTGFTNVSKTDVILLLKHGLLYLPLPMRSGFHPCPFVCCFVLKQDYKKKPTEQTKLGERIRVRKEHIAISCGSIAQRHSGISPFLREESMDLWISVGLKENWRSEMVVKTSCSLTWSFYFIVASR